MCSLEHTLPTIRALLGACDGPACDAKVSGIAYRSDRVVRGDAFFCIPGFAHDGHDYATDAVARGAAVVVAQRPLDGLGAPQVLVADTRSALAVAASRWYGRPSADLQVAGITGTNGKTTCTYLLDSILRVHGLLTGVIGTVETRIGETRVPASRTTPESADLHALLARMRDQGVAAVSMEVSSHAIDLHRVDAVDFAVVAFTNLTQDHLDYHKTIEEYGAVKRRLFSEFSVAERVVNVDDPLGAAMAEDLGIEWPVGRSHDAIVRAEDVVLEPHGSTFSLLTPRGDAVVRLPLAAAYNVDNALVAAGCALALGIPLGAVVSGLEAAPQVPGRMERIECGQRFSAVVDYAHTPDSLEKAIAALTRVTRGKVIAVFGCGGDRDPEKRPLMGEAAGRTADYAIVTSDNPRSEDPVGIILQIEDGIRPTGISYEVEVDRRRAIARAVEIAEPGDAVLVAGKGHEDYQIFADRTVHFDDREVLREVLGGC